MKLTVARPKTLTSFSTLIFFLILLAPVLMAAMLVAFTVDVPYLDEWDLFPGIFGFHQGQFVFDDYWVQHNEHRDFLNRIILVALVRLTGWNVLVEIFAEFLMVVLTLGVLWRLVVRTVQSKLRLLLVLMISILLFSPAQVRNWHSGYQFNWFMLNLLVILATSLLFSQSGKWRSLFFSLVATILAIFSFSTGLLLGPALLLGMFIQKRSWRLSHFLVWGGTLVVCMLIYFYGYQSASGFAESIRHPLPLTLFVLIYLGSPLGIWGGLNGALLFGIGGLGTLGLASYWLWRSPMRPANKNWQSLLPWYTFVVLVILSGSLAAFGRSQGTVAEAISTRYITASSMFWIGLSVIVFTALQDFYHTSDWRKPVTIRVTSVLLLFFILAGCTNSYIYGYTELEKYQPFLEYSLLMIYDYQNAPKERIALTHPNTVTVREWIGILDRLSEGSFRPGMQEYRQKLEAKWKNRPAPSYDPENIVYSK